MPICTIAEYRVRPSGVAKVRMAIEEYVHYVKTSEPGTRVYAAWQRKDDPTQFVHFFVFEDGAAHKAHATSAGVKQFESVYRPELEGGNVVFTDYEPICSKGLAKASA